jgi:hypothetical protein
MGRQSSSFERHFRGVRTFAGDHPTYAEMTNEQGEFLGMDSVGQRGVLYKGTDARFVLRISTSGGDLSDFVGVQMTTMA